jgi:branched-chain amino acid transport system substrate-binding protein
MRARTCLTAVVALMLAACTAGGGETPTSTVSEVRLGVLAPVSGANRVAGTDALHGAQLAAELVNSQERQVPLPGTGTGGLPRLGGAKITIVPADTKSDQERGTAEAAGLVTQRRVTGLVGATDTVVTAAASQRTERLGVPFVNGDTSADYLTERGLDWFFRTGPTDRMLGEAFMSVLRQQQARGDRPRRIVILHGDDKVGYGVATATKALAGEGGLEVVGEIPFPAGSGDFGATVGQVRAAAPDVLFLEAPSSTDTAQAVKAFRQLGYTPPGIMAFGADVSDPSFVKTAGRQGDGLLVSAAWSREIAARNPAAKPLLDLYQRRFGRPMTEAAAGSFTAVLTLVTAIDNAGSVDPQRVRAALLSLDIPGRDTITPWNGVRFDATHQNARAAGVVQQLVQGTPRVVFPRELANADPVWPLKGSRP